jgi:hypothetical protein
MAKLNFNQDDIPGKKLLPESYGSKRQSNNNRHIQLLFQKALSKRVL